MARFESVYSSKDILQTEQIVALSAAHHRLNWIHPFGDLSLPKLLLQLGAVVFAEKVPT